jgi:hypothetical protein
MSPDICAATGTAFAIQPHGKQRVHKKKGACGVNTGQTIFSIAALILLSTVMTNFFELTGNVGNDIASGQDGILLTSLATSYIEVAQGLAFDELTDTMNVTGAQLNQLTPANNLGPEAGNDSLGAFNDIDDFKGLTLDREVGTSGRKYRTVFDVVYVDPSTLSSTSVVRTFCKRLDMKMWRIAPSAAEQSVDTLRMSYVMGYYHFD